MKNINILLCLLDAIVLVTGPIVHHYYWRDYRGSLPQDAISFAGIYIGQIPNHGILPASFYPETGEAVSEVFGKKVVEKRGIKILCDPNSENFYWEYTTISKLAEENLDDLVLGGMEADTPVYIGKVFHEGEWKIGKVIPPSNPFKGLKTWYNNNGTQYNADDFEIMRYKRRAIAPRC